MDSWTKLWMNQVGMIINQSEIDISICVLRIFIIAAIIFAFRKIFRNSKIRVSKSFNLYVQISASNFHELMTHDLWRILFNLICTSSNLDAAACDCCWLICLNCSRDHFDQSRGRIYMKLFTALKKRFLGFFKSLASFFWFWEWLGLTGRPVWKF